MIAVVHVRCGLRPKPAGTNRGMRGDWGGRHSFDTLGGVALLMIVIGILAALRPAIGALRIQPTEALRSD